MQSKTEIAKSLLDTPNVSGMFNGYNEGEPFHTDTDKVYSPRKGEKAAYSIRSYSFAPGGIIHYAYVGHVESRPWNRTRKDVGEERDRGRRLYRSLGLHLTETYPHISAITAHITNPIAMTLRQKVWDEEMGMETYVFDSSSGNILRINEIRAAVVPHEHRPLEVIREYTNPAIHPGAERFPNSGCKVVSVI